MTEHTDHSNRNFNNNDLAHKWNRSLAVVSLLAGRKDVWDAWTRLLLGEQYPERTHFYLVDNSGDAEFDAEFDGEDEDESGEDVPVVSAAATP